MLRIDAHHHLWRYRPDAFGWIDPDSVIARDFRTDALEAALASAGVEAAVAVQARQLPDETCFLLECAASCPSIVGVVGWIDLRAPDIAERVEAMQAPKLVGYRHVVQDEDDPGFLLGGSFVNGVSAVLRRGLTYDLLINHAQLASVPHFLDRVGEGRIVLDHAAKPAIARGGWQPWADEIARIAAHSNVVCKVSGLVTEADHRSWRPEDFERYLAHVVEHFGPERLIWGSDWPVCLLAARYAQTFDLIAGFVERHCPQAAPAIFGGNAVTAYALVGLRA
jgi:L-fuconolactonase